MFISAGSFTVVDLITSQLETDGVSSLRQRMGEDISVCLYAFLVICWKINWKAFNRQVNGMKMRV